MNIRFKLILGFVIIASLLVIVGYVGYNGVNEIFEVFDIVADETAPELIILGQIESLSHSLQAEAVGSVLLITNVNALSSIGEVEEFYAVNLQLDQAILGLTELEELEEGKHYFRDEEASEDLFEVQIMELKDELYGACLDLINAAYDDADFLTILSLKTELELIEEKFHVAIQDRIEQEKEELERRDNIADKLAFDTANFVITVSILGIILSIILGVIISNKIVKPIINLRNVTKEIAQGNLRARTNVKGNDEIAELSSDVNAMQVSLLRQKEELIKNEKINALGNVTSSLAHNLKNPLSVIRAAIGIIEYTSPNSVDKKTQERLNLIKISTENMLNQIEDILDFVKQKPIELKEIFLSEILNAAINNIKKPEGIKINLPKKDIMIKSLITSLQKTLFSLIKT